MEPEEIPLTRRIRPQEDDVNRERDEFENIRCVLLYTFSQFETHGYNLWHRRYEDFTTIGALYNTSSQQCYSHNDGNSS